MVCRILHRFKPGLIETAHRVYLYRRQALSQWLETLNRNNVDVVN
jgi:hypothetical protein